MQKHASFFATLSMGLCLAVLGVAPACAETPPQGQPPAPPPEAYTACSGKTEGATTTLTMRDGKQLSATCRTMNGSLVAMPAGGPPKH